MNFKEMAENIGLEEDEFAELVELFIETGFTDLSNLRQAIDEENTSQVVEAAHSLKGASGNMGFTELFEIAKEVELKACEDSLEGAAQAVGIIKEKLDFLSENFKANMVK